MHIAHIDIADFEHLKFQKMVKFVHEATFSIKYNTKQNKNSVITTTTIAYFTELGLLI